MSFRIIKLETVVWWLESPDHVMYLLVSTVMHVVVPMLLTPIPQWLCKDHFFFQFMEVFWMLVEMKLKKIKKRNFLRKVVFLSGEFVSLGFILQRNCRFIGRTRSVWFNLSNTLSGIVNSRDSFGPTICHLSEWTRSTWIGFTERLFHPKN